jgi:hypothetical protein
MGSGFADAKHYFDIELSQNINKAPIAATF